MRPKAEGEALAGMGEPLAARVGSRRGAAPFGALKNIKVINRARVTAVETAYNPMIVRKVFPALVGNMP